MSGSWDEKYKSQPDDSEPSSLLAEFTGLLPSGGLALDIACGAGRHGIYLAERGLRVVGVDSSWQGLARGRELASRKELTISWVQADLGKFALPTAAFDVILCFYYRDPKIYGQIRQALRPGGLLIYETYTLDQLRFATGPRNPAHLLEPAEVLRAFGDWDVILYRETWRERGLASIVARKPQS
jgi:SAM-dependent methyltransferase